MPLRRAIAVVPLGVLLAAVTAFADAPRTPARGSHGDAARARHAPVRGRHGRHHRRHHQHHVRAARSPRHASHARHTPHPTVLTTAAAPRPAAGTRSAGCATGAHGPAGLSEQTITVRGVARTYLLVTPERASSDPLPLVFGFHGRTGTPAAVRGYLHLEAQAQGGAVFVYPAGVREPDPDRRGRTVTRWEIGREGADIALFDAVLAEVARTQCIDLGRVYAVGHSAGAQVTNELACQRGNALRAVAPIAGMGPFTSRCTAQPPAVWLTHGRADEPVPFHWGEASRDHWLAAAHCASESVRTAVSAAATCERYVGCDGDASVVFCPHGGDHGPPSFAAREVWRFLSAQR